MRKLIREMRYVSLPHTLSFIIEVRFQ